MSGRDAAGYHAATMNTNRRKAGFIGVGMTLFACACVAATNHPGAFAINQQIGRGVNLGNALEAPVEGGWGVTIKEDYFDIIKAAGFNSVRIAVCWSAHALKEKPFTIDPVFFKRIDQVIGQATARGFTVILPMHHYNELYHDPAGHRERFLAIWKQIAERYTDHPFQLVFEPLNEPEDNLRAGEWNKLLNDVLPIIRRSNPNRTIILGPANYNDIRQLNALDLPKADRNIIVTVHYYLPYHFTHQGAHWAEGSDAWLGTQWTGSELEKQAVMADFQVAADWAKKNDRPIYVGEFGANRKADMASRARWTKFVADNAMARGFSFTYWDFCAEFFGLYDPQAKAWHKELLDALIPPRSGSP
jgi:endoglucanase